MYDYYKIIGILQNKKKEVDLQSRLIGLDFDFAKKVSQKKFSKKELQKFVDERYKKAGNYHSESIKLYEKSWEMIDTKFFQLLQKKTESKLFYRKYYCVVSLYHIGISSWGGNIVARSWKENPYTMRKITAHEIIIAHLWKVLEKDFSEHKLNDNQMWSICKVYAWCLLGLDKDMIKFWPWESKTQLFPKKHNYPQLYKLQAIGEKNYFKKGFKEFILTLIKNVNK